MAMTTFPVGVSYIELGGNILHTDCAGLTVTKLMIDQDSKATQVVDMSFRSPDPFPEEDPKEVTIHMPEDAEGYLQSRRYDIRSYLHQEDGNRCYIVVDPYSEEITKIKRIV